MRRWLWLAAAAIAALGAGAPPPLAPCEVAGGDKVQYDWTAGLIRVQGRAPWTGTDEQSRLLARRVAVVDGYRTIGEAIQGVVVTTDKHVKELAAASPTVKTRLEAYVQGAQVVDEWVEEGEPKEIVVVLEAPLHGQSGLGRAVLEPRQPAEPQAPQQPRQPGEPEQPGQPGEPQTPIEPVTIELTGLVIDARPPAGRTDYPLLTPALFPTITDENGEVLYGPEVVDPDVLGEVGGAHYYDVAVPEGTDPGATVDLLAASERIGDKPLWLRGVVVGGPTSSLYVPGEAAQRLRELRDTPILKRARVIILRRNRRPDESAVGQPAAEPSQAPGDNLPPVTVPATPDLPRPQ